MVVGGGREGIYALRSGVDGLWKPCLLNQDKFARIEGEEQRSYRDQILHHIHSYACLSSMIKTSLDLAMWRWS
jgi:hypothetical protein